MSSFANGSVRHLQNRVPSAERVGHSLLGPRIRQIFAVHHQAIFVSSRRQYRFFHPVAVSQRMHGLGLGMPVVESSRDANGGGGRMSELEMNRHGLGTIVSGAVMIMIVLHGCECDWFSLAKLICRTFLPRRR